MYAECLLVAQTQMQSDREMQSIQDKHGLSSLWEVEETEDYRKNVQTNDRYLDDKPFAGSRYAHEQVRKLIRSRGVEVVVVAPQTAALQTCLELFGEEEGIEIHVEPLLQPRINSAAAIPCPVDDLLGKFKTLPFSNKIENRNWFLEMNRSEFQEENNDPQRYCLNQIREKGFESRAQFLERNNEMRRELFNYMQKTKKRVAIVAHPQVLATLTSTGWHEDGKLINPVYFDFGNARNEFVWIEGVEAEAEEPSIPICGV
jgi:hypothetical protein